MASSKTLNRIETLIWVLLYGGLIALVVGIATNRADEASGWLLIAGGAISAVAGIVLIWVRSRLEKTPGNV
ncbi:MAG: hypothetical protein ABW051_06880 [Burkholderiaceae bacterium]